MSGGFFRGTSADQDTRFSNKQAKLLKSQKFAPELEHLVDMTKVKMDVMKPWIAKRVTELIGFEDEVLINFIYGLLEGKAVNGKQVQISLTGFMERNTGKFMKELWTLLLSAQQNVSGVPQQFLEAKEEETKKKKAETDRIANEIQKKREKERQEVEQEKRKMDDTYATLKDKSAELEPSGKLGSKGSSIQSAGEKELYKKNGHRRLSRGSQSPGSNYSAPSHRQKRSPSSSKTSGSQSHLDERRRSRSPARAHLSRSRSVTPDRGRRSSPSRSITPRRRHTRCRSPSPWHRSSQSGRRSTSRSRRRSPSPVRYRARSPLRYRSRSPVRRRSRSPVRRRSRTPVERSPVYHSSRMSSRRRSPSPYQGRSPSPGRGKKPYPRNRGSLPSFVRRRSPSPTRHRSTFQHSPSPSPTRRRYQRSPTRSLSPVQHRSPMRGQKGSTIPVRQRSPQESISPSPVRQTSLSPVRRQTQRSKRSPAQSTRERVRRRGSSSPGSPSSDDAAEPPAMDRKGTRALEGRPMASMGSPGRDTLDRSDVRGRKRDLSPSKPIYASDASEDRSYSEGPRSISTHGSPDRSRERMIQPGSQRLSPKVAAHKSYPDPGKSAYDKDGFSDREIRDDRCRSSRHAQLLESERVPGRADKRENYERTELEMTRKMTGLNEKENKIHADDRDRMVNKGNVSVYDRKRGVQELEAVPYSSKKTEPNDQNGSLDSPSRGINKNKVNTKEKRKQKRSEESDDYSSYDSWEERKEKKRRKEEKKLKKEERRRRREERSRRKEEGCAQKHKMKSDDANSSASDLDPDISEGEPVKKQESRASNNQDMESEQKKLEIELREKALEKLRAKKGISN